MGLRTSRPLLAEDGGSGYEQEEDNEDITEDSDTQTESCWRYMIRKLYSMFGYQELSVNDIKRQTKRKREKLEDDDDDLKDEKEPSQKMAKLEELLQEWPALQTITSWRTENTSIPRLVSSLPTCSVRTRPKMYSMLGYQELSFNDIKRQAKRKCEKLDTMMMT